MSMSFRATALLVLLTVIGVACQSDEPGRFEHRSPDASGSSPRNPTAKPVKRSDWFRRACKLSTRKLELIRRGHHDERSPELVIVPAYPHFFGSFTVTSHSGPWRYLQEVPLVFYGPGFVRDRGSIDLAREVPVADVAPTLAELLEVKWPDDRPGREISAALVPPTTRLTPPRMVLVVVWDGGGWNVLRQWPDQWPFLAKMMRAGSSIENVVAGSSPSVTPAVHATIGTGVFPERHGIVDLLERDRGGQIVGAFRNESPEQLLIPTLADIYDPTTGNSAKIGMLAERSWHMGMVGHGAYIDGGDKDIMALGNGAAESMETNEKWYALPDYLNEVIGLEKDIRTIDLEDGLLDQAWLGHELLAEPENLARSPVQTLYQTRQLKKLFLRESFGRDEVADLFYTNYKQLDVAGHVYNMINPEVKSSLTRADDALRELATYLDRSIGMNEWVMVVTADHGQAPAPISFGAWPINFDELVKDAEEHFGADEKEMFDKTRISGIWLNMRGLRARNISVGQLATFFNRYRLRDNVAANQRVPGEYRGRLKENLFAAAFPSEHLSAIVQCVGGM
jgi:hypothetical protein